MKQTDLDILLHEGEGSMLEYKESFSSSLARELVAFASRPDAAHVPHKYPASHPARTPQVTVLLEAARAPVEIQWCIMGRRRHMKGRGREEKL